MPPSASTQTVGLDEAGRGPLAGPVVAAAVAIPADAAELRAAVTDSKKLSARQRERLAARIREACPHGIGLAEVAEIDTWNILAASHMAMARALSGCGVSPEKALVDGNRTPELPCPVECVVGGDASVAEIAAASILAKVDRDARMDALAAEHPGYGWARNRGYGTREHREALARLGPTPHHRRSFKPVRTALRSEAAQAGSA